MGIVASRIDSSKPLFVACGESKIGVREQYSDIQINRMLNQLTGAIYVSSKSYEEAVSLGLQRENSPYIVLPNGYNSFQFNRVDKRVARSALIAFGGKNCYICRGFYSAQRYSPSITGIGRNK